MDFGLVFSLEDLVIIKSFSSLLRYKSNSQLFTYQRNARRLQKLFVKMVLKEYFILLQKEFEIHAQNSKRCLYHNF